MPTSPLAPPDPLLAAMLVRNAFTHDTRVEKEARTLIESGWKVTVVADAQAGLAEEETRPDGIRVVRVVRRLHRVPLLRFVLHEVRLAQLLRALQPAILHAHDSNALLPVATAARWLSVPFIYDAHELWLHRPRRDRGGLYTSVFQIWYRLLERWAIPRAAAIVTVSPPIARHLARVHRYQPVVLVPNYPEGAGASVVRPLHDLAPSIPKDAPVVLHIGGIMAFRGLEELVEAVSQLGEVHLVFLGAGEHWSRVAATAASLGVQSRVHRVGPVSSDQVVDYATTATIGVVATEPTGLNNRYSLPNKLFQYMAAGIPVVATDLSQIREIVDGERCGLVVDTTSPSAVAGAIAQLLADPTAAAAMGARGRAAIQERLNWRAAGGALLDVYGAVTAAPPASRS